MLTKEKMQEIQDLKLRGYSKTEIIRHYENQGEKPPTRPTLNKYYNMDFVPENPGARLAKPKAFEQEPFRKAIITILETNGNKNLCISSVYDVLMEKFIENGDYDSLPGNEQTLRNYVHYLERNDIVNRNSDSSRVYDYVFETPPGEQMLIDFGVHTISRNNAIHFMCLLLRYSRTLCVFAQDHRYNAEEACMAIYRSFMKLGGRPKQLVIDQDAVFVASETYGEVIKTRVFEDFCREQELKLWVCNKGDPESKGPIENAIGFMKKNFFSARKITCIDDVWRSLPGWLERKNRRIHQTILRVPIEVFETIEKESLRPLLPSLYENSPSSFISQDISGFPYVLYKSSKYSLPREYAFKTVLFKVAAGKVHIYDENRQHICSHYISERKGSVNKLPEHNQQGSDEWSDVVERMRKRWNCYDFQHFINGVKKENPRHKYKQFRAIEQFLDAEAPDRQLVAAVMKECCEKYRYQYSQFKVVFDLAKAGRSVAFGKPLSADAAAGVEYKSLDVYSQAYRRRVRETGVLAK
jgi:hypothetical protein